MLLAEGISKEYPEAQITQIPLADGGEGTSSLFHGEVITLPTTTADGRLTEASYTFIPASKGDCASAVIDCAAASGLPGVGDRLDPLSTDTYGTGVLIADAVERGARRIVLGLGGSATVDGGTGILVALGATPMDQRGLTLPQGGGALTQLEFIDTAQLNVKAAAVDWVLLTDVTNPVTGPLGAAAVFGPQKGARGDDVTQLEAGLARLCEVCEFDPTTERAGAAGAIPVAITWLSRLIHGTDEHVTLRSGAEFIAQRAGLEEAIAEAEVVVTGEGRVDDTSFGGKIVGYVHEIAARHERPVITVCGRNESSRRTECVELATGVDVRTQLTRAGEEIARRCRKENRG